MHILLRGGENELAKPLTTIRFSQLAVFKFSELLLFIFFLPEIKDGRFQKEISEP